MFDVDHWIAHTLPSLVRILAALPLNKIPHQCQSSVMVTMGLLHGFAQKSEDKGLYPRKAPLTPTPPPHPKSPPLKHQLTESMDRGLERGIRKVHWII